jgi:exosortase B
MLDSALRWFSSARSAWSAERHLPWVVFGVGLLGMYGPTFYDLIRLVWLSEQTSYGWIVFILSIWLTWRKWPEFDTMEGARPLPAVGWPLVVFAGALYAIGRSQGILLFEVGSLMPMLMGGLLTLRGYRQLKAMWFPLFFMLFLVPLPAPLIDAVTQPMKIAVSYVTEQILYRIGYPISRTGVMIQIGPYELLVADACAGLNTLFTLEALGLLYLNVVRHSSVFRNIALAILIVPISFTANVFRVMVLTLITYHFGDAAGQGFLHEFAGMVLFLTALTLIIVADSALRFGQGRMSPKETP